MGQSASLFHQARMVLESKFAFGESKHEAKKTGDNVNHIYSHITTKGYYQVSREFTSWCKREHGTKKLEDARAHVAGYLQKRINDGRAASTVRHDAAALAKVYGCKQTDFEIELPKRYREDYVRSRVEDNTNSRHYNPENHRDIEDFTLATGLRRHEIKGFNPNQIIQRDDGSVILKDVLGKGGKIRDVEALNPDVVLKARDEAISSGSDRIFEKVPCHMDVHANRAKFADELYRRVARDITTLPEKELYRCRKDKYGIVYDRKAMLIVSRALGHERIDVIAQSYLNNAVK